MPAPLAAAKVHAAPARGDAGALGQVERRLQAAEVDLLAHEQFPELAFRTGIDGLDVGEVDFGCLCIRTYRWWLVWLAVLSIENLSGALAECRARTVSSSASTRAVMRAESEGE